MLTTAYTTGDLVAEGVYPPQEDSQLLIDVMDKTGLARGRRVADLCTGSGVVAIARSRARGIGGDRLRHLLSVRSISRGNKLSTAGVEVRCASGLVGARRWNSARIDLVVCNPPYVPHDPSDRRSRAAVGRRAVRAWDAGYDGRLVLDPLCASRAEPTGRRWHDAARAVRVRRARKTLAALASCGLDAEIFAWQWIPFGPVLTARAQWLEDTGRLDPGRREEELVVIRADKRMSDDEARIVRVVPSGPVMVQGPVRIEMPDGSVVESDRFMVAICTCRRSKNYPLCDTSHRRRQRSDEPVRSAVCVATSGRTSSSPSCARPAGPRRNPLP